MESNLYENKIRFRLVSVNGPMYSFDKIIKEPLNIRDADYVIDRDDEYFGFAAEYIDENARLEFDNEDDSGRAEIEMIFNTYGNDGIIKFYMEVYYGGLWNELINANLNLNTYNKEVESVSCCIEKVSFNSLFRTRFDTSIYTNETVSLDGYNSPALSPKSINIQAQSQRKTFVSKTDYERQEGSHGGDDFAPNFEVGFPRTTITTSEFNDQQDMEPAIARWDYSNNLMNWIAGSGYCHFRAERDGWVDIKISGFTFQYSGRTNLDDFIDFNGRAKTNWKAQAGIVVFDANGAYKTSYVHFTDQRTNTDNMQLIFNPGTCTWRVYMQQGWGFVYYGAGWQDGTESMDREEFVNGNGATMTVVQVETLPPTKCNAWKFKDVLVKNLEMITGSGNLKSDFLTQCQARTFVTNGWNVRRVSKPLQTKMKDIFATMNALWNVGYTLTTDSQGNSRLVVEPMKYFFQNKKIISLSDISDYKEESDKNMIYNEVEIGYDKYVDSDAAGQEAFNTKREYLLPIKTAKKKLTLKSPFIADGFVIEKVRSYQYDAEQPVSTSEDDYTFLLCLNAALTTSVDDGLSNMSGIVDPYNSYNFRLSPARMFMNWQYFINSVLAFKTSMSTIGNRACYGNKFAKGQTSNSDCGSTVLIQENQDFPIDNSKKLFYPLLINFKAPLSFEQFITIKDALLDKGENANGYIEIASPFGFFNIFVKQIKYNPINEIAEIRGWKKY